LEFVRNPQKGEKKRTIAEGGRSKEIEVRGDLGRIQKPHKYARNGKRGMGGNRGKMPKRAVPSLVSTVKNATLNRVPVGICK